MVSSITYAAEKHDVQNMKQQEQFNSSKTLLNLTITIIIKKEDKIGHWHHVEWCHYYTHIGW